MKNKVDYRNSIPMKLQNYYGEIELNKTDDRYYLILSDHSSVRGIEIDSLSYDNLLKFINEEPFTI